MDYDSLVLHNYSKSGMNIIYLLLAISVCVAIVFFVAFVVSVKQGQYDDTYTPSVRMLFEDEIKEEPTSDSQETNEPINNMSN